MMLGGLWPPAPWAAIPSGGRPPGPPRARFRARTDRFPAFTGTAFPRLSWLWQPVQKIVVVATTMTFAHGEAVPDPGHRRPRRTRGASPVTHPGFRWPLSGPWALQYRRYRLAPVPCRAAGGGFCRIQIPGILGAGAQVGPDPGRVDAAPWIHRVSCPGSGAGPGLGGGRTGSSPEIRDHA